MKKENVEIRIFSNFYGDTTKRKHGRKTKQGLLTV